MSFGTQAECWGINSIIDQHKNIIPRLNLEVQVSSQKVNAVIYSVERDIFVDDLLGGEETREDVDKQVRGTIKILGWGGFGLKFVINNGIKPILRMCEWTTGETEVPIVHSDGNLALKICLQRSMNC